MSRKIRLGVSVNEKIYPVIKQALEENGMGFVRQEKHFFADAGNVQLVFARVSEITRLVVDGHLDIGFVTKDHLSEFLAIRKREGRHKQLSSDLQKLVVINSHL